jgi:hypothetical protein
MDKMKKAGKSVVDAGAKTMLKVSKDRFRHAKNVVLVASRFSLRKSICCEF